MSHAHRPRRLLSRGLMLSMMVGAAVAAPAAHAAALPASPATLTTDFAFTGAVQTWTVPAGVTKITVSLTGANGGDAPGTLQPGGRGGKATAELAVVPGTTVQVNVGGDGISGAQAGWNGGGAGPDLATDGASGGGATDVRVGGTTLADRVLVAGGGGGSANTDTPADGQGGAGGGSEGADAALFADNPIVGGEGGKQDRGGDGGVFGSSGTAGQGGDVSADFAAGGGGGGGWYGGASSLFGSGGGSGHGPDGTVYEVGTNTGTNGAATITFPAPACATCIQGTVTDGVNETRVGGIRVRALQGTTMRAQTMTAADGSFAFTGLPVGSYTVQFNDTTVVPSRYPLTNYGQGGATVAVATGTAPLDQRLTPYGAITGTITDQGTATLTNVRVRALVNGVEKVTVTTDSNGTFTLPRLLAGSYQVQAVDLATPKRFVPQWYVNAYKAGNATLVPTGTDITMVVQVAAGP